MALAALNLFPGFCAGCYIYYQLAKANVVGFKAMPLGDGPLGMRPHEIFMNPTLLRLLIVVGLAVTSPTTVVLDDTGRVRARNGRFVKADVLLAQIKAAQGSSVS